MRGTARALAVGLAFGIAPLAAAGGALDASFGSGGLLTIESGPWGGRFAAWGATRTLDPANPDAVVLVADAATDVGLGVYSAVVTPGAALVGPVLLGTGSASDFGAFTRVLADPTDPLHRLYAVGDRYVQGGSPPYAFLVARLGPLGDGFDPSWNGGAPLVTAVPGVTQARPTALAVQPDGKLVVAGSGNEGDDVVVARYDADALDATFGTAGATVIPGGGFVTALAVQDDGGIVLGGLFTDGALSGFGVMRLLGDGTLDTGFGTVTGAPGVVFTAFAARYSEGAPAAISVLSDGRILAAGSAWDPFARRGAFVAARYLPDGTLDPTFNRGKGSIRKRVGKSNAAGAVAFLSDGATVIVGTAPRKSRSPYHDEIAFLRLDESGRPDATFGRGGKVVTPVVPVGEGFRVSDVVVDSAGRLTVVGVSADGSAKGTVLARYLP